MREVIRPVSLWQEYLNQGLQVAGELNSRIDSFYLLWNLRYAATNLWRLSRIFKHIPEVTRIVKRDRQRK